MLIDPRAPVGTGGIGVSECRLHAEEPRATVAPIALIAGLSGDSAAAVVKKDIRERGRAGAEDNEAE